MPGPIGRATIPRNRIAVTAIEAGKAMQHGQRQPSETGRLKRRRIWGGIRAMPRHTDRARILSNCGRSICLRDGQAAAIARNIAIGRPGFKHRNMPARIAVGEAMPTIARRLVITGRVQRVSYRDWAVRTARGLGLTGWVRNRPDGSVEALASGAADAVRTFIGLCHAGPPAARVEGVAVEDAEPPATNDFIRRPTDI